MVHERAWLQRLREKSDSMLALKAASGRAVRAAKSVTTSADERNCGRREDFFRSLFSRAAPPL
jgi:hypothetical protein